MKISNSQNNFLHCYLMTDDAEFAPNPHHEVLTLATCKPKIRKYAAIGDWIAGWTSKTVRDKFEQPHHFDEQKLIYLAKIEDIIPIAEYWEKYPLKRPKSDELTDSGDNIYKPISYEPLRFEQIKNSHHGNNEILRDLSGENVLICKEFYYFGWENAQSIDKEIFDYTVPRWKKISINEVEKFINSIRENYKTGILKSDKE